MFPAICYCSQSLIGTLVLNFRLPKWKTKSEQSSPRTGSASTKRKKFSRNVSFLRFRVFRRLRNWKWVSNLYHRFTYHSNCLKFSGLTFCIQYKLSASDLVSSWDVYSLNRLEFSMLLFLILRRKFCLLSFTFVLVACFVFGLRHWLFLHPFQIVLFW